MIQYRNGRTEAFLFHSSNWCDIDYVRIAILYFCTTSKEVWIDAGRLSIIISIDPTSREKINLAIRFIQLLQCSFLIPDRYRRSSSARLRLVP